jgi:hypothetical protein
MQRNKIRKKRIIAERIVGIRKSNDDFDIKFWQKAGAFERFSAAWKMIEEFYMMKGINGHKLRLQRYIQNIQQA